PWPTHLGAHFEILGRGRRGSRHVPDPPGAGVIIQSSMQTANSKVAEGEEMIFIDGLVKRFGPFTAVDGISFSVSRGEVLGFLGPNGAGKSTTMKMITGFLAPS